jgi:hypothetical protein
MLCVESSMMYGTPNNINHSGTLSTSTLAGWHIQCSHAYDDLMGNKFSSIGLPESDDAFVTDCVLILRVQLVGRNDQYVVPREDKLISQVVPSKSFLGLQYLTTLGKLQYHELQLHTTSTMP